jgi:hypothetical protein
MQCNLVDRYQFLEGARCIHLQGKLFYDRLYMFLTTYISVTFKRHCLTVKSATLLVEAWIHQSVTYLAQSSNTAPALCIIFPISSHSFTLKMEAAGYSVDSFYPEDGASRFL